MSIPAIEIDNLSVVLGGQQILSGFDLGLFPGQKTTLTGRSGCGKSTLLRCLLGFVVAQQGAIRIFGRELTNSSVWSLRARMAYVPQEPELGSGPVGEILKRPFSFHCNRHLRENLSRLPALMERLQLSEDLLTQQISTLSGGQKQRIALLSAVLLDREILLLDEASSALDPVAKRAVITLLKECSTLTVLSVSHDQEWIGFSDELIDLTRAGKKGAP